jgi:hypothetical protein
MLNGGIPILFPDCLKHNTFLAIKELGYEITSAGFISIFESDELEADAYGESVSLRVKSNPKKDSSIITKDLRG